MNSRERILAALRGQPVDRIPFAPHVDGYWTASLPPGYQRMSRWELFADLGVDLFVRARRGYDTWPPESLMPPAQDLTVGYGMAWTREAHPGRTRRQGVEIGTSQSEGEVQVVVDTPVGSLRSGWQHTPESPFVAFPTEPLLKTAADLETYRYVAEHTTVEPWYEEIEEARAALEGRGVVAAYGHCTPIMDLAMFHTGIEGLVYLLQDDPAEVESLLTSMQEIRKREYRVLAASAAEVVVTYENTSTTVLSPACMARYEFPAMQEYTDILHAAGKTHLIHMCGKIGGALDLIAAASFDGIIEIAPPPTGDCDFRAARVKLGAAGKTLGGGIDCTAFVRCSPQEIEEYVWQRLREVAPGTGFWLDSGDAVPFGTPLENMRAIVRSVEKHGAYPIKQ